MMLRRSCAPTTVLIALTLALVMPGEEAMAIEKPEYTVIFENDGLEIRQYQSYLVAETLVKEGDTYQDAANEGFRRLFRYISGDNSAQQKIDMTSPVQQSVAGLSEAPVETVAKEGEKIAMTAPVQQEATDEGWLINFMLPGKFRLDSAPQPDDSRIVIREVPGQLMAVRRYSGRWTSRNFDKHSQRLMEQLNASGVGIDGGIISAVYNPPFMPPFMRRNEVMVAVDAVPTID
jgi:hypothetical protein